ncbi:MAG: hypothetical protein L6R39_002506 [Caloplaca ligustica]|nr:MAG: hypothetical protein L6R39_002506 [Caloplaca ligustica]
MSSSQEQQPYVLTYRRNNIEENQRLDSQHQVIKHGILDGLLIHPSIPVAEASVMIADLGCGTGIWLDDVANTYFARVDMTKENHATLIGFDVNSLAFNTNPAPGVQLIEHDCTKPFDPRFTGRFDLVNIRGLAYALPSDGFSRFVQSAVQILS